MAEPETVVIETAGTLSGTVSKDKSLSRKVEAAMVAAAEQAMAEGITDQAEVLALKLAARELVKAEHRAAIEAALSGARAAEEG